MSGGVAITAIISSRAVEVVGILTAGWLIRAAIPQPEDVSAEGEQRGQAAGRSQAVKAAALVLALVAVFRCIPDGRYRTALVLGAIAGCTAACGYLVTAPGCKIQCGSDAETAP